MSQINLGRFLEQLLIGIRFAVWRSFFNDCIISIGGLIMNKSTLYIIITIILFLVINNPLLQLFSAAFHANFWFSEIVIIIIVILLMILINWILNKLSLKNI